MKNIFASMAVCSFLLCMNNAQADLIASWEFDGNLDQPVVPGPQILAGTGYSFTAGVFGDAVLLTGNSSFLDIGMNTQQILGGASDYTISLWFNATVAQKQNIISFDDDSGWFYRSALFTDENGIRAAYTNGNNQTTIIGYDTPFASEWVHVALTQDINNGSGLTVLELFVNGQSVATGSVSSNPFLGPLDYGAIGRYHIFPTGADELQANGALEGHASSYAGAIDRLQIWNEVLSPTAITSMYDSAVPEPSTVALLLTGCIGLAGYGWRRKKQLAA